MRFQGAIEAEIVVARRPPDNGRGPSKRARRQTDSRTGRRARTKALDRGAGRKLLSVGEGREEEEKQRQCSSSFAFNRARRVRLRRAQARARDGNLIFSQAAIFLPKANHLMAAEAPPSKGFQSGEGAAPAATRRAPIRISRAPSSTLIHPSLGRFCTRASDNSNNNNGAPRV